MHLGEQVKAAREAKGVGMYTLARVIGVSPHTMIKFEADGWPRRPSMIQDIADHLGCEFSIHFKPSDGVQ